MEFDALEIVPALIWGFLVGFVGWGAYPRLPVPIARWLLQDARSNGIAVGIAVVLVALFLMAAIMFALCFVPLLRSATQHDVEPHLWRDLYGLSFMSSLIGFVSLGVMRRFRR
ncbi:hypothetical protein [Mesorhizobium sp. M1D.F.Ca.ET.234.01.1.1]|uniref:hypothetical protein n=1 Tax=Mesorhizobium sp. M1D.F.Ca.ET.234.01.1.1 TaxID=2563932 RepID=UPI001091C4A3|nr:hypothetical protein [Mesorhizobium sp. M1D.F.Ca.ET.234.01.1.1]TGP35044.1 hypothetical protein EN877_10150 [Mesorhizobium sp. M1D.F.Ca.ET.234.01.1.1]